MANRLLCLSTTFLNPLDCQLFNAFQYRGLKRWQLLKSRKGKKALPKTRKRDGKTYTVDHLYWERYFSNAPQVLLERQAVNTKSVSQLKPKVSSPARLYETFTKADKRYIVMRFQTKGYVELNGEMRIWLQKVSYLKDQKMLDLPPVKLSIPK